MRTALLLLLLANVVLFGYARLDRAAQSEAGRLGAQVQPDRIRVLSSQQVAALGPGKVAALPDVCVEWGPFAEADRLRALADIEPLQLGRLLTQRSAGADPVWWVNTGPVTTRGAADKRAAELRLLSIDDLSVVDMGKGQFTVSLGMFRTEGAGQRAGRGARHAWRRGNARRAARDGRHAVDARRSRSAADGRCTSQGVAIAVPGQRPQGRRVHGVLIRDARVPDEVAVVRSMFREYAASLDVDLCFQDFDGELAQLPGYYAAPGGCLLLAEAGQRIAGCVALRPLESQGGDIGEVKRLYVRPAARGSGAGRALAEAVIARARAIGYGEIRLDTLATMDAARALYASLGFRECAAYYVNPLPGVAYMSLRLRDPQPSA
jgi:ribosomal protein S18 acetylase RimI-like enzyme